MIAAYIIMYGFVIASAGVFAWWDTARCGRHWAFWISFVLALCAIAQANLYPDEPTTYTLLAIIAVMLTVAGIVSGENIEHP